MEEKPKRTRKLKAPATTKTPPKKRGRVAVKNTPENFFKVLQLIEFEGISARKAMQRLGVDSKSFDKWLDSDELNAKQYARACSKRADLIFEEMKEIADKQDKDVYFDADGNERIDHNVIHRNKLQIDTRKWMLSKMMPKKYGDRLDLTTNNESLNKPEQAPIDPERINKLIDGLDKL
jgi:hypothetical protein